jgi:uncharacterized membrane protein YbhN (UPF0104 family)
VRTLGLRPPNKITLLKVLLAIIVLVAIVRTIDVDRILEAASGANGWFILAGVVLLPANLLLESLLWHRLVVACANPKVRFGRAFGSLLLGHSLGLFTPARAGEFVGRPLYLGLADKWRTGLMVVAHRVMDLTCVVVVGTLSLIVFRTQVDVPYDDVWIAFTFIGGALGVLMLAVLLLPGHTHRLLSRTFGSDRLQNRLSFLRLLSTRTTVVLLSLAGLRYLVYTSQFLIFLYAFAPNAPAFVSYAAVTLVMFAKFIIPPVTFTDLGIREGASVFFFSLIAVDAAFAFNASILIYFTNLLLPSCLGFPFVFRLRVGKESSPQSPHHATERVADDDEEDNGPAPALLRSKKSEPVQPVALGAMHLSRGEK